MLVLPGLGQLIGFRFHSLLLNFLDTFLLRDTVIYVHVLCVFIFLCHSMELPLCGVYGEVEPEIARWPVLPISSNANHQISPTR